MKTNNFNQKYTAENTRDLFGFDTNKGKENNLDQTMWGVLIGFAKKKKTQNFVSVLYDVRSIEANRKQRQTLNFQ